MKEKITVCLYGISGVYNYGCEAMIRAISSMIKKEYPSSNIIYKTYNYEYDKKHLEDCDTVIVSELKVHARETSLKHKLYRGIKYLKKKIGIAKEKDRLPYSTEWLEVCDYLVIIGGDVFDLLPGQIARYDNERIWASKVAKKSNAKIILWGISVGNFDLNSIAKNTLIDYFKNIVDIAIIRDEKSLEYLKENGVTNAYLCADPAFMIRDIQTAFDSEYSIKTLGVNLSPLANRYLKIGQKEGWTTLWSNILFNIYKRYNYKKIILLPHVVNKNNSNDDDYSYLKKIELEMREKGVNVETAPQNIGFIGIKKYLVKCNLVMSARMHCSVNAITCGVPTLFLSYSSKSIGMCEFVYGNSTYVIDMNKLVTNIDYNLFDKIDSECDSIRKLLKIRNVELCTLAKNAIRYFDMEANSR